MHRFTTQKGGIIHYNSDYSGQVDFSGEAPTPQDLEDFIAWKYASILTDAIENSDPLPARALAIYQALKTPDTAHN